MLHKLLGIPGTSESNRWMLKNMLYLLRYVNRLIIEVSIFKDDSRDWPFEERPRSLAQTDSATWLMTSLNHRGGGEGFELFKHLAQSHNPQG